MHRVTNPTEVEEIRGILQQVGLVGGAYTYLGECSTQVVFPLSNGSSFRIGYTDGDAAVTPDESEDEEFNADGIVVWADTYEWKI